MLAFTRCSPGSSLTTMPADTELTGIEFGGGRAGPRALLPLHCPGGIFDTVLTTRFFPDQAACFPRSSLNAVPSQALAIDFGRHALPRTLLRTASTQLKHRALAKSSNFQPSSNRCPSDPRIMKRATWRPISDAETLVIAHCSLRASLRTAASSTCQQPVRGLSGSFKSRPRPRVMFSRTSAEMMINGFYSHCTQNGRGPNPKCSI